ncbi:type III polyketide synthase [Rossellomorea marisflavi]|uniref:type III polyketide synthase n=1 Tax=Rossellomorea marisflavi TaxID=189381 RepID=UPI003459F471
MPVIYSVETAIPPHRIDQEDASVFAKQLFQESFKDIDRLLTVFQNGEINSRYFVKDLEWFGTPHSFEEKNEEYIKFAVQLGKDAVRKALETIGGGPVEAIFTISTSGIATPSIEARIMNELGLDPHIKRIPIWGLGCAGGASGLARAHEYCRAFPSSTVLVLAVELCSLTFQHGDRSKSNLIGTSLFADGIGCAVLCGDDSPLLQKRDKPLPRVISTRSTLLRDSLDVMGWEVRNEGLYVVFSKSIPNLVETWLRPNVEEFLLKEGVGLADIRQFVAHPGGKKVLDAYEKSLGFPKTMMAPSLAVLQEYGNMSSATILYVMKEMLHAGKEGEHGLAMALGPGFSSELLLLRWEG